MKINRHIRKIATMVLWLIIGAGMIVLLVAAMRKKDDMRCAGLNIVINGAESGLWFMNKADVVSMLTSEGAFQIENREMSDFDLRKLEARLEKDDWVMDAELFFDNNNILQVEIREREPLARIFTSHGSSFYIDEELVKLPLSARMSARLPVFTNFPSGRTKFSGRDSLLLYDIRKIATYMTSNPFWMAQVTQVDITPSREFVMIPLVGSHVIEFGDASDHEEKFRKLKIFYRNVFAKAGMGRYTTIKAQYDQQVVAVNDPRYVSRADSLSSIKNIQNLIASAYDEPAPVEGDTIVATTPASIEVKPKAKDPVSKEKTEKIPSRVQQIPKTKPDQKRVPKAVMPGKS